MLFGLKIQIEKEAFEEAEKMRIAKEEGVSCHSFDCLCLLEMYRIYDLHCSYRILEEKRRKVKGGEKTRMTDIVEGYVSLSFSA